MRTNRTLLRVTALLVLVVPIALMAVVAHAATARVGVVDDAYDPAEAVIRVGDSVSWVWRGTNPHSVTAANGAFDSHPNCTRAAPEACGTAGAAFTWTASEAGSVRYFCRFHGPALMSGVITVDPPAEPTPPPSPSASPSPSPKPSPTSPPPPPPSPSPDPEPEPSPRPSPTAAPSPSPSASPSPSPSPAASPSPDDEASPAASPTDEPSPSPTPTTSLEAFPSPSASPEDIGEVAVDVPRDGGGPGRIALLVLGTGAVIGSAGVFGRVILFGEPWEG